MLGQRISRKEENLGQPNKPEALCLLRERFGYRKLLAVVVVGGLAGETMPKGAPVGWVLSPDLPLGGRGYCVLTKP